LLLASEREKQILVAKDDNKKSKARTNADPSLR